MTGRDLSVPQLNGLIKYRILPLIAAESILKWKPFFVALKKRPTEALFRAYKKRVE